MGSGVGAGVGAGVETEIGSGVDSSVGASVGSGADVGSTVGLAVGFVVGLDVGFVVGFGVGEGEADAEGDGEAFSRRDEPGSSTEESQAEKIRMQSIMPSREERKFFIINHSNHIIMYNSNLTLHGAAKNRKQIRISLIITRFFMLSSRFFIASKRRLCPNQIQLPLKTAVLALGRKVGNALEDRNRYTHRQRGYGPLGSRIYSDEKT